MYTGLFWPLPRLPRLPRPRHLPCEKTWWMNQKTGKHIRNTVRLLTSSPSSPSWSSSDLCTWLHNIERERETADCCGSTSGNNVKTLCQNRNTMPAVEEYHKTWFVQYIAWHGILLLHQTLTEPHLRYKIIHSPNEEYHNDHNANVNNTNFITMFNTSDRKSVV